MIRGISAREEATNYRRNKGIRMLRIAVLGCWGMVISLLVEDAYRKEREHNFRGTNHRCTLPG